MTDTPQFAPASLRDRDGFHVEIDVARERGDIILDRPPLNVISMMQRDQLRVAFEALDADPAVRVIVLRAKGEHFSSGGEIRGFLEASPEHVSRLAWNIAAPARCMKPVIAAARGYCFGVGFELSLASDFRLVSETCLYALPEQRLGQIPGSGRRGTSAKDGRHHAGQEHRHPLTADFGSTSMRLGHCHRVCPRWRKLMRLAARSRRRRDGALQAQIAVAVSILTFAPIRLDNLATLDCERNLVPSGAGQALHVVVPGEQVKNRKRIEHPLPAMCVKLIMRYLREFRPHLTTKGNTALFPGKSGGAKWQNVLRYQISRTVYAHTGLKVNPHLFRHIDAKLYLDRNPGGYEVVRLVLGHRSSATTRRFYSGTETAAAVRHFDETILAIGNRAEEKVIGRKTKKK